MLKEEMDAAAERHPDVEYEPVLVDALYAGLVLGRADKPLSIPALNRDGDLLSELVIGPLRLGRGCRVGAAGAQRRAGRHRGDGRGTAPALEGKDIANPMAMILACAAVLHYAADRGARGAEGASKAIYEAVIETLEAGIRTPDLKGHASTTEFTDAVIERVGERLG